MGGRLGDRYSVNKKRKVERPDSRESANTVQSPPSVEGPRVHPKIEPAAVAKLKQQPTFLSGGSTLWGDEKLTEIEELMRKGSRASRISARISKTVGSLSGHSAKRKAAFVPDRGNNNVTELPVQDMDANIVEVDVSCWADRGVFLTWMMFSTTANMILLAMEADLKCWHNCKRKDLELWEHINNVFTALAIVELIITMVSAGPLDAFFLPRVPSCELESAKEGPLITHPAWIWLKKFLWEKFWRHLFRYGPDRPIYWFRFIDLGLVVLRTFDVWIAPGAFGDSVGLKYFAALRVLHVPRSIRRMYSITAFRELWLILENVQDTLKTVVFVMLLLCIMMWTFAIAFTIMAGERVPESQFSFQSELGFTKNDFWGTVPKSFYSLFQVVTRDQYGEITRPIVEQIGGAGILIALFLVLTWMAALSTMLGAVVESTLQSATLNREKQEGERRRFENRVMNSIILVFQGADKDENGMLSREELEEALEQESVKQRLKVVMVRGLDLKLLFTMLDDNATGEVNLRTFFRGCVRLRGEATSRDLNHLQIDVDRYGKWVDEADRKVSVVNDMISDLLDIMDKIDRDVVQDPTQDHKDPVMLARRMRQFRPRSEVLRNRKNKADDKKPGTADSAKSNPRYQFKTDNSASARLTVGRNTVVRSRKSESRPGQKRTAAQAALGNSAPGSQPPPPPIPEHLLQMFEDSDEDSEGDGMPTLGELGVRFLLDVNKPQTHALETR